LDRYQGHPIVWHAGTGPGYVADTLRVPDERLSVFVLCNGVIDSRMLSRRIADLYLGVAPAAPAAPGASKAPEAKASRATAASTPPAAGNAATIPDTVLDQVAGRYRNPDTGTVWTLTRKRNELLLDLGRVTMRLGAAGQSELHSIEPDWGW